MYDANLKSELHVIWFGPFRVSPVSPPWGQVIWFWWSSVQGFTHTAPRTFQVVFCLFEEMGFHLEILGCHFATILQLSGPQVHSEGPRFLNVFCCTLETPLETVLDPFLIIYYVLSFDAPGAFVHCRRDCCWLLDWHYVDFWRPSFSMYMASVYVLIKFRCLFF